jgi:hypothetical protein
MMMRMLVRYTSVATIYGKLNKMYVDVNFRNMTLIHDSKVRGRGCCYKIRSAFHSGNDSNVYNKRLCMSGEFDRSPWKILPEESPAQ